MFGTEIFKSEIHELYDEQTERRNELEQETIDEFNSICLKLEKGICNNNDIVKKVIELSEKLKTVKGKLQYGYLPKNIKAMVDEIVDELEKDEDIKRLYDLWYECKCKIFQTYTDNHPSKLPLSQEKVFKPIRNAVIKRASELAFDIAEIVNEEDAQGSNEGNNKFEEPSSTIENDDSRNTHYDEQAMHNTSATNIVYSKNVLTKVTRLGKDISNTFRDNYQKLVDDTKIIVVDSRLKQEIEAKKKGINIGL